MPIRTISQLLSGGRAVKPVIIVSLAALLLALALPLSLTAARAPETPAVTATAAPEGEALLDEDLVFTALTDGETRSVTMADWLPGVLAAEMPASFEPEALKAQAVAARTYILSRRALGSDSHPEADVCDDPACCTAHLTEDELREKWGENYDAYMSKILAAVQETDGQYLSYGGAAIQAVFHSSSPGQTEDSAALWGALPYLVSVSSPETAEDVPNYVTEVEVSVSDFASTLRAAGQDADLSGTPDTWVGDRTLDAGGRVETVVIGGLPISGADMRSLFGLRSAAFTLDYVDGAFLFTVTGYGHGVGMSQYGANVMANAGSGYADILAHYYPGTTLTA